tara:strand:- start:224 stop:484 length:261 start_codon:yes stop_codon:yes gene_type:complete
MGRDGDVWMSKYETYSEKKWLERHGIWEDSVHLRKENCGIEDKQRWEHCGGKGIVNKREFIFPILMILCILGLPIALITWINYAIL